MNNRILYILNYKIHFIFYLLLSFILFSCKGDLTGQKQHDLAHSSEENLYEDGIMQNIYTYQNERNSAKLLKYLNNEYPEYRKASVLAFASVQDSAAVLPIAVLFDDSNEDVRTSVAYSLGQIGHVSAEQYLIKAYAVEKSGKVKKEIIEAIGKCGGEKGLLFICTLEIPEKDYILTAGLAWGLTRFAIRGLTSAKANERAMDILSENEQKENIRFIVSHYFANASTADLTEYHSLLVREFKKEGYIYTKINLAAAFAHSQSVYSLDFLHNILENDYDYRIKISAINASKQFDYELSRDMMLKQITDVNTNISVAAAEFFLEKGIYSDAAVYNKISKSLTTWQARTIMLKTALKYSNPKEYIASSIISGYEASENIYEKAGLLAALEVDLYQYRYVANEIFYSNNKILSTTGMQTLINMRNNVNFSYYADTIKQKLGDDLYDEFALIFKKAVISKDVALVAMTAEAMRKPEFNMVNEYSNNYFLTQALNNCILPQDFEAYNELIKTIKYFNQTVIPPADSINYAPIDWQLITSLDAETRIIIKTTKGDFVAKLNVNQAPMTVATFIKLVQDKYYDGTYFYKIVPNYIIQDGCKRGDGWGSSDFVIRSEFAPTYSDEGSIGMMANTKDTESVQWFITQYPNATIDGNYTLFGNIVEGLDNIHKLEVGDKILTIEIQ